MRTNQLDRVKFVISYIYSHGKRNISAFQLAKALYLVEYLAYKVLERPILDIPFVYHHFGPYPKTTFEQLYEEGYFSITYAVSSRGRLLRLHHPKVTPTGVLTPQERWIVILATLTAKRESRTGIESLREIIYSTEPMKAARKNEPINMLHAVGRKRLEAVQSRIKAKRLLSALHPTDEQKKADLEFLQATEYLIGEDYESHTA